ncbi:MAG: non-canonical purine NTP pyrophosphatase [Patescibacteria group bacterium]
MKEILIATSNIGKFNEIKEILEAVSDSFKLISLKDFELRHGMKFGEPIEDGETFEDNALIKAKYYFEKSGGMLTLAEDSGIIVDELKGELGVKTRRWGAGEKANDQEWIEFFMNRMNGVENRAAEFVCCGCLMQKNLVKFFRGETKGTITSQLEAEIVAGIPLSSCFRPDGLDRVYSALSVEEKNKISHRGKAISHVAEMLKDLIA